jgi:hypothetical protein
MSLSSGFSPKRLRMILAFVASSTNSRSTIFVVRMAATGDGQAQVGDATLEIVLETGERGSSGRSRSVFRDRRDSAAWRIGCATSPPRVPTDLAAGIQDTRRACYQAPSRAIARRLAADSAPTARPPAERVIDHQQRIAEASGAQVLKERPHGLDLLP